MRCRVPRSRWTGRAVTTLTATRSTYPWDQISGTPVALSNATARSSPSPRRHPPRSTHWASLPHSWRSRFAEEGLRFQLTVTDHVNDQPMSSSQQVSVLVYTPSVNSPPVVTVFSTDVTRVNDLVQLDGSYTSDLEGDPLTYLWERLRTRCRARLSAHAEHRPANRVLHRAGHHARCPMLTFRLTVSDGQNSPVSETVNVLVGPVAISGAATAAAAAREPGWYRQPGWAP